MPGRAEAGRCPPAASGVCQSEGTSQTAQFQGAPASMGTPFFWPAFRPHESSSDEGVAADVSRFRQQTGESGGALREMRRLQVDVQGLV